MEAIQTRRIVLLGKTGVGKSSLANTILGENLFTTQCSPNSETSKCESKSKIINGKKIHLIDTPGVFDTNPRSTELSPEILKCIKECSDGVHAFLIVLRVERYTIQEQAVVNIILKYFSEEALKYATVVFTRGRDLNGMKIKEWAYQNTALKTLVEKCGGRCLVFDNRDWNNIPEVAELLKTIDQTVENNGKRSYTNDMLSKGVTFWEKLQKSAKRFAVGALLGVLLGVGALIALLLWGTPFQVTSGIVAASASGIARDIAATGADGSPSEIIHEATLFLKELDTLYRVNENAESARCRIL